ncbi:MAG: hypothetical protein ACRCX2_39005 [Paraclostridium sp.]
MTINLNEIIDEIYTDVEGDLRFYKKIGMDTMKIRGDKGPRVLIVMNQSDPASELYVKKKRVAMETHGIESEVIYALDFESLMKTFKTMENFDSVIYQLPLSDMVSEKVNIPVGMTLVEFLIHNIPVEKDIDRLNPHFIGGRNTMSLPATSRSLLDILISVRKIIDLTRRTNSADDDHFYDEDGNTNVLFIGNGYTTNRRLIPYIHDVPGMNIRMVNTKTSNREKADSIDWAHVIVSSTGIPESLRCVDKIVISPTIHKKEDGSWVTDLAKDAKDFNITHRTTSGIGKLTIVNLLCTIWYDYTMSFRKMQGVQDAK